MKLKYIFVVSLFILLLSACNTTYDHGALPQEEPPVSIANKTTGTGKILNRQNQGVQIQASRMHQLRASLIHDESQMLDWINEERRKRGMSNLRMNPELSRLARMKALEMIQDDYLSHVSPRFGSVETMLNQAGVDYGKVGENVAGNFTLDGAHTSLMNSPSHRANILNPEYEEIGIGLNRGGEYGHVFVQLFISRP